MVGDYKFNIPIYIMYCTKKKYKKRYQYIPVNYSANYCHRARECMKGHSLLEVVGPFQISQEPMVPNFLTPSFNERRELPWFVGDILVDGQVVFLDYFLKQLNGSIFNLK